MPQGRRPNAVPWAWWAGRQGTSSQDHEAENDPAVRPGPFSLPLRGPAGGALSGRVEDHEAGRRVGAADTIPQGSAALLRCLGELGVGHHEAESESAEADAIWAYLVGAEGLEPPTPAL